MRRLLCLALLSLLVFIGGCAAEKVISDSLQQDTGDMAIAREESTESLNPDNDRRYVVRDARFGIDVEDLNLAIMELENAAKETDGWLSSLSVQGEDERRTAVVTVRVPEKAFDRFTESVLQIGKVTGRSFADREVTRQYIDMEARIKNLERQEARLLAILDQAKDVSEILEVERELGRVRGDLESLQAEFLYLQDKVQYATFSINLRETPLASPVVTGSGLKGVWQRGMAGLVTTVNMMVSGFGSLLVFTLTILPLLLLVTILLSLAWVISRRKKGTIKVKKES